MDRAESRRERLGRILDLAQTYRGWTRKELARALRRDPTKLVPGSGVPKLDLVVDLAGVLDWSIEDVVSLFWDRPDEEHTDSTSMDFDSIDATIRDAHSEGQYEMMIKLSKRAFEIAETPNERAMACNREAGGWDGLGRYQNSMKAVQLGLQQSPVSAELRRVLQSNLANAYYSLWSLVEAKAVASDLLARWDDSGELSRTDRWTRAFANYVVGHTHRRLLTTESDEADQNGARGRSHLERAIELYTELAHEESNTNLLGIAATCRGGLVEIDVATGQIDAEAGLQRIHDVIEEANAGKRLAGDSLESIAWWCIFGCNIALRSLDDERDLQSHMAVFTNKADEIAEQIDSWSLRERVFTMEHTRWERAVGCTGFDIPCVVDQDDVRIITGTMARYPSFRETGWQILNSAKVVGRD